MTDKSIQGNARICTVRLGDLRVSGSAQREVIENWADHLDRNFNLDMVGTLTVSHRNGVYWIVDGQHRHFALTRWAQREFGDDWAEWTIQVWAHEGLNEQDEARLFLSFNNSRAVSRFERFRVEVTAGLPVATDIDALCRSIGLRVQKGRAPGAVSCIAAMERLYNLGGAPLLRRTLTIVGEAWGGIGFDSDTVHGVGLFINRYEGRIDDGRTVRQLATIPSGSRGLRHRATAIRESHGATVVIAHAAAVNDVYNKGLRGSASLGSWWKGQAA